MQTTISIQFSGDGGGQAGVAISGPIPADITYDIDGSDVRSFDLPPGVYSIAVDGTSGNNAALKVTDDQGNVLCTNQCNSPLIVINDTFIV